MVECQIDVTAKAESRLHPRYTQMKDARPFEGISDKSSGELSDQKRLSILSWNAGGMVGVLPCDYGPRGASHHESWDVVAWDTQSAERHQATCPWEQKYFKA